MIVNWLSLRVQFRVLQIQCHVLSCVELATKTSSERCDVLTPETGIILTNNKSTEFHRGLRFQG